MIRHILFLIILGASILPGAFAGTFESAYRAAGQPKAVLHWSRSVKMLIGDESLNLFRRTVITDLITAGVKLVDLSVARQLQFADKPLTKDIQRHVWLEQAEAEALLQYTDTLIILRADEWHTEKRVVVISIVDVQTRQLLAQKEYNLLADMTDEQQVWVASSKGYMQQDMPDKRCEWQATAAGFQQVCEADKTNPPLQKLGHILADNIITIWRNVL